MTEIRLDWHEAYAAGCTGLTRNLEAIFKKRKARFPEKVLGELFVHHIHGAMAEIAVAKYLNQYWSYHVNHFDTGDVGDHEIRFSNRRDLKVRERDKGRIISVSGSVPLFTINGWIEAEDAKNPAWSASPRPGPPAYFVPHDQLKSMGDF